MNDVRPGGGQHIHHVHVDIEVGRFDLDRSHDLIQSVHIAAVVDRVPVRPARRAATRIFLAKSLPTPGLRTLALILLFAKPEEDPLRPAARAQAQTELVDLLVRQPAAVPANRAQRKLQPVQSAITRSGNRVEIA